MSGLKGGLVVEAARSRFPMVEKMEGANAVVRRARKGKNLPPCITIAWTKTEEAESRFYDLKDLAAWAQQQGTSLVAECELEACPSERQ